MPQEPKDVGPDPDIEHIEPGFFGPADAHTHNIYECYISPAVTARYVKATKSETADWKTLPLAYIRKDGIPTYNLLGYDILQRLDSVGKERCSKLFFPMIQ